MDKGPIAMLQEFVQCSKRFPLPPNHSALHWTCDPRMATRSALEYRATVAFYLDGVPHHVAGDWHASKKGAQRDTADKALALFVGRWGADAMQERSCRDAPSVPSVSDHDGRSYEERLLEEFCACLPACGGQANLRWSVLHEDCTLGNCNGSRRADCFAVVELELWGVPHKLAGAVRATEQEAILDATRRALWYLKCLGFEQEFEAERLTHDRGSPGRRGEEVKQIPAPPRGWLPDDSSEEAFEEAKRKTVIMRAQNRLQQEFARHMRPGQSVWQWRYATDSDDEQWPPLFRATVAIPVLDREFAGAWVRGQRNAQLDAVAKVLHFLDELCCLGQNKPPGKAARWRNSDSSASSSIGQSYDPVLFQF